MLFRIFVCFCAVAAAAAALTEWPAAPDDGGLKPYLEEIGKNTDIFRTLITNSLPADEARAVSQHYDNILLPGLMENSPNMTSPECQGCKFVLSTLRFFVNVMRFTYDDLRDTLISFCELEMSKMDRPGAEICPGVLDNYGPLVVDIVKQQNKHRPKKSELEVCTFLTKCPVEEFDEGKPALEELRSISGVQSVPPVFGPVGIITEEADLERQDPPVFGPVGIITEEAHLERHRRESGVLKIVQIADVHFDKEYEVGAVAECGYHVCCRKSYNGTGIAGLYGEYMCNAPMRTVKLFLEKAKELNPDVILQTGDTPSHHLWYETPEGQLEATTWLAQQLKATMGEGVPLIPAIGNHDIFPSNMYYVSRNETKDMHDTLIDNYPIFSDENRKQTFSVGGYFEYTITSGLKAIVYNSNYGYPDNWYNVLSHYEQTDYLTMRQFVENKLAAARRDGVKVVLVTHHPVGHGIDDFDAWVSKMALDYSDVIVLHTSGHKHTDQFRLFIEKGHEWASGVQFAAPSSNTYNTINPSLRVYHLDKKTFQLLDFEQYYMDLQQANAEAESAATTEASSTENPSTGTPEKLSTSGGPDIQLAYSAREEYNMTDLSPVAWHELAVRMMSDIPLLNKYETNLGTRATPRNTTCAEGDSNCLTDRICQIVTSTLVDNMRCNRDGYTSPNGDPPTTTKAPENEATSLSSVPLLFSLISISISVFIF